MCLEWLKCVKCADLQTIYGMHANNQTQYVAAIHLQEMDVTFSYGGESGRPLAELKPGDSRHPDIRRSHGRKTKTPLPNRPHSGNALFDGVLQGQYRWQPGYVSSKPAMAAAGATAAPRFMSPPPARPPQGRSPAVTPADISRRGVHTPANLATPRAETPEDRRVAAGWLNPHDGRRGDPAELRGKGKFVTDFERQVAFGELMVRHTGECGGHITWAKSAMVQKGLAGKMTGTCSKGRLCRCPEALRFESSTKLHSGEYVINLLYSAGILMTPAMHTASSTLCDTMMLKAPDAGSARSGRGVYGFQPQVSTVIAQLVEQEEDNVAEQIRNSPAGVLFAGFDAAHPSQRGAQQSCGNLSDIGGSRKMVKIFVSTEGSSESREPLMLEKAFEHCAAKNIDMVNCAVDGARDTRAPKSLSAPGPLCSFAAKLAPRLIRLLSIASGDHQVEATRQREGPRRTAKDDDDADRGLAPQGFGAESDADEGGG